MECLLEKERWVRVNGMERKQRKGIESDVLEILFLREEESFKLFYIPCLLHFGVKPHNRMVLFD